MANEQDTGGGLPSDAELFRKAMAPEPAPVEQPQPQQSTEQPRDEQGRFARAPDQAPTPPPAPTAPPAPTPQGQQPPPEDENDVPSWRHREMRLELEAERQQ